MKKTNLTGGFLAKIKDNFFGGDDLSYEEIRRQREAEAEARAAAEEEAARRQAEKEQDNPSSSTKEQKTSGGTGNVNVFVHVDQVNVVNTNSFVVDNRSINTSSGRKKSANTTIDVEAEDVTSEFSIDWGKYLPLSGDKGGK